MLFLVWLRSVVLRWSNLITGGLLAAAYFIYKEFGLGSVEKVHLAGGLFILFFIASFLTWYEKNQETNTLQARLDVRRRKDVIRLRIGQFIATGNALLGRCADWTIPPPTEEIVQWEKEIRSFYQEHLDDSYLARLGNSLGLNLHIPQLPEIHIQRWNWVATYLARMEEFLQQLNQSTFDGFRIHGS